VAQAVSGARSCKLRNRWGSAFTLQQVKRHHECLKDLGASKVFDYRVENVVESIVMAAKEDGVKVQMGFDVVGQLKPCMEILEVLKWNVVAKLASTIPLPDDLPNVEGVEAKLVAAPENEKVRTDFFHFIFGVWLKEKVETGQFVPSPKIQAVEGG
jgi:NADPH:quinone reductase-like Zn-dependent oxidoreductase